MSEQTGTVYALIDPRYEAVRYVGSTKRDLKVRLNGHVSSPGPNVRPWVEELKRLGLAPMIRTLVAGVPLPELLSVERREMLAYHESGCILLNVDGMPPGPGRNIVKCQDLVERSKGLGDAAERAAALRLTEAVSRDMERRAFRERRRQIDQDLYPDDRTRQRAAVLRFMESYADDFDLPEEEWPQVAAALTEVAVALRGYGFTFKDVLLGGAFDVIYQGIRAQAERRRAA